MRCDFCGEEIEAVPFHKDGMGFCSQECADAMETGESLPLVEEVLDDPDDDEDEDEDKDEDVLFGDDYVEDNYSDDVDKEY
jgi:hypothetical protein